MLQVMMRQSQPFNGELTEGYLECAACSDCSVHDSLELFAAAIVVTPGPSLCARNMFVTKFIHRQGNPTGTGWYSKLHFFDDLNTAE